MEEGPKQNSEASHPRHGHVPLSLPPDKKERQGIPQARAAGIKVAISILHLLDVTSLSGRYIVVIFLSQCL